MIQIGTVLIGCVFLFSGGMKVLFSQPFIAHVRQYGVLPDRLSPLAALIFIEIECGLGTALVLYVFPFEVVSFSFVLIAVLSVFTFWGVKTGRVEDCGCYGDFFQLNPMKSLALNLFYLLTLALVWLSVEDEQITEMWKVWAVISVIVISGFLSKRSVKAPLIDFSKLKAGKPWNPAWIEEVPKLRQGRYFVVFFNKRCSLCRKWILLLNETRSLPGSPEILGVVPGGAREARNFQQQHAVDFSIVGISQPIFRLLTGLTPAGVLVENGIIRAKWIRRFPEEFTL